MVKRKSNGFSAVEIVIAVFVVLAVGIGGWYVWQKHDSAPTTSKKIGDSASKDQQNNTVDPYEGWQTYTNATYGVSFRYPSEWNVNGASVTPSSNGLTKVEYAINLARDEQVKYNDTASLEILQQTLKEVEGVYDGASSSATSKTADVLKGRQSVQYSISSSDEPIKRYLFSVGDKTYIFSSLNEAFNVYNDSDYWTKFNKVFDSLQINTD